MTIINAIQEHLQQDQQIHIHITGTYSTGFINGNRGIHITHHTHNDFVKITFFEIDKHQSWKRSIRPPKEIPIANPKLLDYIEKAINYKP